MSDKTDMQFAEMVDEQDDVIAELRDRLSHAEGHLRNAAKSLRVLDALVHDWIESKDDEDARITIEYGGKDALEMHEALEELEAFLNEGKP